jgi:predicted negative regulator of RcsB-dependent stress response
MGRLVGLVVAAALMVRLAHGQLPAWPVAGASYRYVIERLPDSPLGAALAEVTVWPVGVTGDGIHPTVTTEEGQVVGAEILWRAAGQPWKIVFDSRGGASRYHVYLSTSRLAYAPAWTPPEAGCLLEVRDWGGGSMDTVEAVRQAWGQARRVQGRGHVPNIFAGRNPFGPPENLVALFRGMFIAPVEGQYRFGTSSDDASVLLINGQLVAEWVGAHGADPRSYVERSGKIWLPAGPHRIEYYWIQGQGDLVAVAAWQLPGSKQFEVMPARAFTPVARFGVAAVEAGPSAAEPVVFEWGAQAHSVEGRQALCEYRFRVFHASTNTTYRWWFDDGQTASGAEVTHVFVRPGLRRVRLQAGAVTLTQEVDVQPRWDQEYLWSDEVFGRQRARLLKLDVAKLPVADLAEVTRLAVTINDMELLTFFGRVCLRRAGELDGTHADIFFALGGHFALPAIRDYAAAAAALRAGLAAAPADAQLVGRLKLRLARLLLDTWGRLDETDEVLKTMATGALNDEQRRMLAILRADLTLARGHVEEARRQYEAIGRLGELDRARYSVQRQARLESARAFVARREWEAAETLVRAVEWEVPAERLAPEFGLLMGQIHQQRGEYERALWRYRRVLLVAGHDDLRANVLFRLVEVQAALNDNEAAERTLGELFRHYPYSEAAARAKERWGKR